MFYSINTRPIALSVVLLFSFGQQKADKDAAKFLVTALVISGAVYAYKKWPNTPATSPVKPITKEEYLEAQKKLDDVNASEAEHKIIKDRWQEVNNILSDVKTRIEDIKHVHNHSIHPCRSIRERFAEWSNGSGSLITHCKQYSIDNYLCGQLTQIEETAQMELNTIHAHLQKKIFQDQLIPVDLSNIQKKFAHECNTVKSDVSKLRSCCEKYHAIIQNHVEKKQSELDEIKPQLQKIINHYHEQNKQ